jgi:hypothetical protein
MLEEKIDLLTKEVVALRKAVEANTEAGGATAPAAKGKPAADADEDAAPKTRTRGRPKKEEVTPEHDAEEVENMIRQVSREVGKPVAKKIIAAFKCDDLADLLTHPEHFDAAFAKAEEALAPEGDEGDEEDDI